MMRYSTTILITAFIVLMSSCDKPDTDLSHPRKNKIPDIDRLSPELLWTLGRMGNYSVSPNGEIIAYTVSFPDIKENRFYSDIYTVPVNGGEPTRITRSTYNESQVNWRPDGEKINFLSSENGSTQLMEINPDGSGRRAITDIDGGVKGYKYSPDLSSLLFVKDVKLEETPQERHSDLPKTKVRIENDLMYRHWDRWHNYHYSHIFIADATEKIIKEGKDIMEDEPFDSPLRPFGGMEQITWSPCNERVVYTAKKLKGKDYATSTNSDLYLYDITSNVTINLTEDIKGYDKNPLFSPDGTKMLWESMERDGYESDKNRLMVMDMESGEYTNYSYRFDHNVSSPIWDDSGKFIWFTSNIHATEQIYLIDLESNEINRITEGKHNFSRVTQVGESLIAVRNSMNAPADIFKIDMREGSTFNLTNINQELLKGVEMGRVEEKRVTTSDNQIMLTWVIYPPDFDPEKRYPTILYCQGGPQSGLSQFWSYRWNFQMMAANDYIIVAPNRRGMPGFGTEWNEQISGDWGGRNLFDYLDAIDYMAEKPYVDNNRLGAVGASYGGYSTFWLAGNHEGRFNAFIAHGGVFNLDMMYTTTEELFFVNWDLGGPYWEMPDKRYEYSPHLFVDNWDTPIMVTHGKKDYRVPYSQGIAAFNAARVMDIPAKLLMFPEETHWILSPQNGVLWQREFANWLDKYLK
ncbi:S9 family peptidase [Marinilabiliaceae bacterium ANBcel2]|nr:S9 family peptidase [Marinilabiliaceae bacterium ANBcel2]